MADQPIDIDDPDGDNLNDLFDSLFDKIKANDAKLSDLIKVYRRNRKLKLQKEQEELAKQQEEERKKRGLELKQHRKDMKSVVDQANSDHKSAIKLPELKIPEFDGEPTNWKTYWQQFEATIHQSKRLDDQIKMQYLLKSLVSKKAKDAIQGIDAFAEAYPEAIAALKARFDKPQIIHRAHVRSILNAKSVKEGSSAELHQLHDSLQHNLRSLKALNQLNLEQFITALGETKLDATTMIEWQKYCQGDKEVASYEKFLQFLDLRATATELNNYDFNAKKPSIVSRKPAPNGSTNTRVVSSYTTETEVKCTICNEGKHRMSYCPHFKRKSVTERRNIANSQRACFNCLRIGHMIKECPSDNRCRKCDYKHHTLLHLDAEQTKLSANSPPFTLSKGHSSSNKGSGNETQSYLAFPNTESSTVLMMTAEVIVSGPKGGETRARARYWIQRLLLHL